jgi:hypothetical protein
LGWTDKELGWADKELGRLNHNYRLRVGQVVSGLSSQKSLQFKWERDEILLPMFCPYVLLRVQPIDKCEEA